LLVAVSRRVNAAVSPLLVWKVMENQSYPCPSCGFLVFYEPPGSYDICSICGWEDDHVQLKHPLMRGGANGGSLFEYQQQILKEIPAEVKEHGGYIRSPDWFPLRPEDCVVNADAPHSGLGYFLSATEDAPPYYWKKDIGGD
jgi:hypothetical protein